MRRPKSFSSTVIRPTLRSLPRADPGPISGLCRSRVQAKVARCARPSGRHRRHRHHDGRGRQHVAQRDPHYVHFLANGYDFVKGSRFISGGSSLDITSFRRLGNRFLLAVFNSLYQGHLTDLCYGFCAFDRRYLEHLHLSSTGFEIEAEMTVRAMPAGLRIAEVPSVELPRRSGASNLHAIRDGIRVLRTVLRHHRSGVSGHLYQAARQAAGRPAVAMSADATA